MSQNKDNQDVIKKSTVGRPRAGKETRKIIMTIRGSNEYNIWIGKLAKKAKKNKSELMSAALLLYSRSIGFTIPPKR